MEKLNAHPNNSGYGYEHPPKTTVVPDLILELFFQYFLCFGGFFTGSFQNYGPPEDNQGEGHCEGRL